jgi:hypothetical protein
MGKVLLPNQETLLIWKSAIIPRTAVAGTKRYTLSKTMHRYIGSSDLSSTPRALEQLPSFFIAARTSDRSIACSSSCLDTTHAMPHLSAWSRTTHLDPSSSRERVRTGRTARLVYLRYFLHFPLSWTCERMCGWLLTVSGGLLTVVPSGGRRDHWLTAWNAKPLCEAVVRSCDGEGCRGLS